MFFYFIHVSILFIFFFLWKIIWKRPHYERNYSHFPNRLSFPLRLFFLALLLRLIGMIIVLLVLYDTFGEPFPLGNWGDDRSYHFVAVECATAWSKGDWSVLPPYSAGYRGYPWLLSWIYYFLGPSHFIGVFVNGFFGTFTCLITYWLGRDIFNEDIGRKAALLLAIFPLHIYYCSFTLKDPLLLMLLMFVVFFAHKTFQGRRSLLWLCLCALSLLPLFFIRKQISFLLGIILVVGTLMRVRKIWQSLPGIIILFCIGWQWYQATFTVGPEYYLSEYVQEHQKSEMMNMRSLTSGIAKFADILLLILGYILPFATLIKIEVGESIGWQVGSSIFLWNIGAGFSLIGIGLVMKRHFKSAYFVWATPLLIFLGQAVVYVNTILDIRQKLMLVPFACILAVYAYREWKSPWRKQLSIIYVLCVLVGTCVYSYLRLRSRGMW